MLIPACSSCIDLKCLLYVCVTVKIQFANTIIMPTLGSVAMLPRAFGSPYSKILDPPLAIVAPHGIMLKN